MNLEELCSWLSHQKGMMAQTYAKDLAKYIVRTKLLSDEEIEKCVVAWVREIYGNGYVTPSDIHIAKGTRLIRLAEEMRINK